MYKDSHVHTVVSHDGKSTMREYMENAKKMNVDEITFTEHYDIYDGIKTSLHTLDVTDYYKQYMKNKDDDLVKTNFGIEIGLQPYENIFRPISDMVKHYDFDFIIGSSHITEKKDMAMDPSFFEGLTRKQAYLKYFKEVLQNIKKYNNEFDVYGHLDYVVRYGGYDEKSIEYKEFREILDEILFNLVRKDKGLEINTSGIRYGLLNPHPNIEILKRFKELGGHIVTIGSDAHNYHDLASNFDLALEMLENAGFDEIAVFNRRIPEFVKTKSLMK